MNLNEFKEKYKNEPKINDVLDYLIKNGYESKEIMFNFEQAKIKEHLWIQELNKKKSIKTGETKEIIELNNGFKIVQLIDQESRTYEGKQMRHCVASYSDNDEIYSLRDKDNNPHCTIQLADNLICQIKGVGNGTVSPKYVPYVLEFLEFKDTYVEPFEMENIGYHQVDQQFTDFINLYFKGAKFIDDPYENKFIYTQNRLELVKSLKNNEKSIPWNWIEYFCSFGQSPLFIKNILKRIDPNPMTLNKWLHKACENNQIEIVKLLLKKGADISSESEMPLFYAAANGHLNLVKLLMRKGADPVINNSSTILVSLNQPKVFKYFFRSKKIDWSKVIMSEKDGFGLLACAISIGASDSLRFLLKKGIKPVDSDLALAGAHCDLPLFKLVIRKYGKINDKLKNLLKRLLIQEYNRDDFANWLSKHK